MNLIKETKTKLNYYTMKLKDMENLMKGNFDIDIELGKFNFHHHEKGRTLTKDAEHYLRDEISKTKKNIKYYSELLEVLEKDKEDKK